jgi:hypothetical protein
VVNEASDANQLVPMVEQSIENTGEKMQELSADSGYCSGHNLHKVAQREIDAYIPDPEYQSNVRKGKDQKDDRFHKTNFLYNEAEDTYTCPAGEKLHFSYLQNCKGKEPLRMYKCSSCQECLSVSQCTKNRRGRTLCRHPYERELQAMRQKLSSPEGKTIYNKRKKIVEPVFGIIKSVIGFSSFLLRGLFKVKGESNLVAIAYNLRKIASYLRRKGTYVWDITYPMKCQPI